MFTSITEAKQKIELWRLDFNRTRPHTSLGGATPEQFAQMAIELRVPKAPEARQPVA